MSRTHLIWVTGELEGVAPMARRARHASDLEVAREMLVGGVERRQLDETVVTGQEGLGIGGEVEGAVAAGGNAHAGRRGNDLHALALLHPQGTATRAHLRNINASHEYLLFSSFLARFIREPMWICNSNAL
jgi:hypothetical protein